MSHFRAVHLVAVFATTVLMVSSLQSLDAQEPTTEVYAVGSGRKIIVYASTGAKVATGGGRYRGSAYLGWIRFSYRSYIPQPVGDPCYVVRNVLRQPGFVVPPPPPFSPGEPCPPAALNPVEVQRQQVLAELANGFAEIDLAIPAPVVAYPAQAIVGLPVRFSVDVVPTLSQTVIVAGVTVNVALTSTVSVAAGDVATKFANATTTVTPRAGEQVRLDHTFDYAGPLNDPKRGSIDVWVTQSWTGTWSAPSIGLVGLFTDELVAVNDVDLIGYPINQLKAVLVPTTP